MACCPYFYTSREAKSSNLIGLEYDFWDLGTHMFSSNMTIVYAQKNLEHKPFQSGHTFDNRIVLSDHPIASLSDLQSLLW